MKKTRVYQTKTFTFTLIIVQENHSQLNKDNNRLIEITIAKDLQIEEFHKIYHKMDKRDQTVKMTKIEKIIIKTKLIQK